VHNPHPEHVLEAVELVIPVQQFVLGLQTESSDQTIDSLADSKPALAQVP